MTVIKIQEVFNDCFLESTPVRMSDMQWSMTVKPKFRLKCCTCRWMYMGNSSRQVLSHVASHMFKLYKEPMFVCGLCKFGNANRSVVARHIKSVHEDKADVVNNMRVRVFFYSILSILYWLLRKFIHLRIASISRYFEERRIAELGRGEREEGVRALFRVCRSHTYNHDENLALRKTLSGIVLLAAWNP